MKTATKRIGRRILVALLAITLLLPCAAGQFAKAAEDVRFTLMPSSEQFRKVYSTVDQVSRKNNILNRQSGHTIYLAQNEREGLQAVFCETALPSRGVRLEVSDFVHTGGGTMKPLLYKEEYMELEDWTHLEGRICADALVPYNGEAITADKDIFLPFYIEVISAKDSMPGEYTATVSLIDDTSGTVLASREARAVVWSFVLPEGRYSDTAFGAYDEGGTYGDRNWFLRLNGAGWVNGADNTNAKAVIKGWYDFLLSHGINAFELPRDLIVDDPRAAQEYLTDPRVNSVVVPYSRIQEYKALANGNDLWQKKLYAYPDDEPNCTDPVRVKTVATRINRYRDLWPELSVVVPFGGDMTYVAPVMRDNNIDILCPNQGVYGASNANFAAMKALGDEWKTAGGRVWTYPNGWHYPTVHLYSWEVYSTGPQRRAFFWQQYQMGFNGLLFWCTGYWRGTDGNPHNPWVNNTLPAKAGVALNNGDGVLVYPAGPLGLDPTVPIASLRLKQIADGLDDFDYLTLAEEFLGRDFALQALNETNTLNFDPGNPGKMFSETLGAGAGYTLDINKVETMRRRIGDALSVINTEHNWGERETILPPDTEHEGIAIRICQDCDTQESEQMGKLPATYTVTVQNDSNGTASASAANAAAGTEIILTATPDSGYQFKEWQVVSGDVTITANKFTMPGNAVTVQAIFELISPPTYELSVNSGSGSNKYAAGTPVTITAYAAPAGQVFDKWVLTSGGGTLANANSASTTYTMPANVATVTATYKAADGGNDTTKYIKLWGKTTGYVSNFWNWCMVIFLFGWIWMAF